MATPFSDEKFTFTQPDGSKLDVRGWGNQYAARFETLDGYTVTKNPQSGFWEIATVSADGRGVVPVPGAAAAADGGRSQASGPVDARLAVQTSPIQPGKMRWEQRRAERKQQTLAAGGPLAAPPQRTTVGEYFGLCLLIDFSDEPATIPQTEVEVFCNKHGYKGFGNNGSVYDYFHDNSLGRLKYKNIVTPYYRAQFPKTHYTDPSIPFGQRAIELITEALQHWLAVGFNFSQLTADAANNVYATNVFYAGARTNNWSEGLWPHAWVLNPTIQLLPGKIAHDYQITDIGSELSLGTFCHENGHLLCDYPDLYDYGLPGGDSLGVGGFCLMCRGGNLNQKNPTNVSAYLKRAAGWAGKVTALKHGERVSLCADKNEFAIHAKNATEYFLIEHRTQRGRDASLPDAGLAIWHADETGDNSAEAMTAAEHYELSLEQADGLFEFEQNQEVYGDGDDLFARRGKFGDSTTPDSKWWDGSSSNLTIDRIAIGKLRAAFRASFPRHAPEAAKAAEATSEAGE